MKYVDAMKPEDVFPIMESRALETLYNIKAIMDDETLKDPECFHQIEAIINVFEDANIETTRHDW